MPPSYNEQFFERGDHYSDKKFCKVSIFKNIRVPPCKILNEKDGGIYTTIFDKEQKFF